jgi:hypothetical protein
MQHRKEGMKIKNTREIKTETDIEEMAKQRL